MTCGIFLNILENRLPILEYLDQLLSDFQTIFSNMMGIKETFVCM